MRSSSSTAGNVATWNPGAERIKGYAPEEIIGQHFSQFYTDGGSRSRRVPRMRSRTAAAKGRFEAEGWRVRKDGTRSGPLSSSIASRTTTGIWSVLPR